MIMSSQPQPIVDPSKLRLPSWKLGDKLLGKFSEFNGSVDELVSFAREQQKWEIAELPDDADASEFTLDQLNEFRDERRNVVLKLLQTTIALFDRRGDLLAEAIEYLSVEVAQAEKGHESAKSKIRKLLTQAGLGAEAQQGWPANPGAAKIQLDHLIARSTIVRDARAESHDSANLLDVVRRHAVTNEQDLAASRGRLSELVNNLVAS